MATSHQPEGGNFCACIPRRRGMARHGGTVWYTDTDTDMDSVWHFPSHPGWFAGVFGLEIDFLGFGVSKFWALYGKGVVFFFFPPLSTRRDESKRNE